MKTYVISLRTSTDRRAALDTNLSWLKYEYINAIDFRRINFPLESFYGEILNQKDFSRGALGCLLSHRYVWKKHLKSDDEFCLILEDDVCVNKDLFISLESQFKILMEQGVDVLFLGANNCNSVPKINAKIKMYKNFVFLAEPLERYLYGAYGYIVSKNSAAKLLNLTTLKYPVDYWGKYNKDGLLEFRSFYPNIIFPSAQALQSSTASKKDFSRDSFLRLLIKFFLGNLIEIFQKIKW